LCFTKICRFTLYYKINYFSSENIRKFPYFPEIRFKFSEKEKRSFFIVEVLVIGKKQEADQTQDINTVGVREGDIGGQRGGWKVEG
jgi:hypothetical protein